MAKILISPIGTGRKMGIREYGLARYKFDGDDKFYETSFISAAIAEHLTVDRIIFVGTAKSMWEEIYRYFTEEAGEELDIEHWVELGELSSSSNSKEALIDKRILRRTMDSVDRYLKKNNINASGGSLPILIRYGLDKDELWQNFDLFMKIIDTLDYDDEIYLDITHSFRSIPLFMYLMMDFIQTLGHRNIRLRGLYYGMLEASADMQYAPIVDLNPLFQISKWIKATYDFVNYGNGYMISKLVKDREIADNIENISELVNINYL
ncbi:MAG: TIGR02221 family CRISPR-associated protein, partial [Tissierellia bacterium]|nr:TIGR02221 family CRISPR-associated protein [Tissierellia bacterium]